MNYQTPDFPKRVELEMVASCNLQCTFCPRRFFGKLDGFMDFGLFEKIINEIKDYPDTIIVLHRRGESLLHPEFNKMLNLIAGKFKDVQLATNATVLTSEKFESMVNALTFISFSIDVPEQFEKTRVLAKYDDVEKNILNFLDYNKGKVQTQVSMVNTSNHDQKEIDEFVKRWSDKVDRVRIYEEHSSDGAFGSLERSRSDRKPCAMPIYELLIYYDGMVGRCNHDWDGEPMGDVSNQIIKEIWYNDKYQNLRIQHKKLEFKDEVCKNCDSWYPEIGIQGTGEVFE